MYLEIKVAPNAKTEKCIRQKDGTYSLSVKERAHNGKANERACELLAQTLRVPKNKIRIKTGSRGRNKLVEVLE